MVSKNIWQKNSQKNSLAIYLHNSKILGKGRKMENLKIEQHLSNYKNSSQKPRQNLKQNLEQNIYEEKTFRCDICSKSFKKNSSLKQHILSVHGGKTFKCEICPPNFTHKRYLKIHNKSVHGQKKIQM